LLCLTAADCCGVGAPELWPRSTVYVDCYPYECPVAVGAKQAFFVLRFGDQDNRVRAASLDVAGLAGVSTTERDMIVYPHTAGESRVLLTLADGSRHPGFLRFHERATTNVVASLPPPGPPRGGTEAAGVEPPLMFEGTTFTVIADHRDAGNNRLLGHGLEQWSVSGGTLAPVSATPFEFSGYSGSDAAQLVFLDTARVRSVTAGSGPRLVVHARGDSPPFEADVAPAGSTARLELAVGDQRFTDDGELTMWAGTPSGDVRAYVMPLSQDDRLILGSPRDSNLEATVDDPDVVLASVLDDERAVTLVAQRPGRATLEITFDGVTRRLHIEVR
jgi:hypothetical protein